MRCPACNSSAETIYHCSHVERNQQQGRAWRRNCSAFVDPRVDISEMLYDKVLSDNVDAVASDKIQGNESSGTTISKALVGRSACLKSVLECGFNNSLTATCRWKKSCSSRRDGTLMFWYECLFRSRKKFSVVEQWTIVYSIKWCYCMWFITTQKLMWTHPIAYLRERASNVCQMCVCARISK